MKVSSIQSTNFESKKTRFISKKVSKDINDLLITIFDEIRKDLSW